MSSNNSYVCALCGYRENLLRCSRCKVTFYCSKEHQKSHWKNHKDNCGKSSDRGSCRETEIDHRPTTLSKTKVEPSVVTPNISSSKSLAAPSKSQDTHKILSTLSSTSSKSLEALSEELSAFKINSTSSLPLEGSSEAEILATSIENLSISPTSLKLQDTFSSSNAMPVTTVTSENIVKSPHSKKHTESSVHPPYLHRTPSDDMVNVVIEDLNSYGLCVLDNFCGPQMGKAALQEVLNIYSQGIFQDGQLVAKSKNDSQSIRSDKIMWVDGKEVYCRNIGQVLNRIDNLVMKANKSPNNGKLGQYSINGRTKAMLAVYPGSGTHYVKHVDNPNNDGRCITSIYYLNVNWDIEKSGGLLRIFPENEESKVADIAPVFDRLLLFWSDRQNPHEVQPAYDTRYAITLWYFDAAERTLAAKKFELEQQLKQLSALRTSPNREQLKLMQELRRGKMQQKHS